MHDQKRILFFSFDRGTGIGHLRKMSRIAAALQGPEAACLIVTDRREAVDFLVSEGCEFLRLPGWDGMIEDRAAHFGRVPFLATDRDGAKGLRIAILRGVVEGFKPDAIVVDHIPLGGEEELDEVVFNTPCRKYLTTRGVQNETEDLRGLLFEGRAREALERAYDAILAVTDRRVFDFTRAHDLGPAIARKTRHMGYIAAPVGADEIAASRQARGAGAGRPWVVVTAGGGQNGEGLIEAATGLAVAMPDALFDIVLGPRSRLSDGQFADLMAVNPHVRVQKVAGDMAVMNASADLVITGGGYNTMIEVMQGEADMICAPLRASARDEQHKNAMLFSQFVNVDLASDVSDLPRLVRAALARPKRADRRRELDFDGVGNVARWIMDDLRERS